MLWVVVPTHGRIAGRAEHLSALDVARLLTAPERVLPVFTNAPGKRTPYYDGEKILQPYDRGSAAEILLALHRIETVDPQATVVVLPADASKLELLQAIEAAIERATTTDRCILVFERVSAPWTGALAAPLPRLMEVFQEEAPWLVVVLRDFFNAASPLLPRTLEELFRIL